MSALLFLLQADGVYVATDSLSLAADTKKPFKYATKIFYLPHLQTIVCGTGSFDMVIDWYVLVQKNVVARNILYLNEIAPAQLRDMSKRLGLPNELSSTIYHFGFLEEENRFVGYVYRSAKEYASEQLPYSVGFKPPDGIQQEVVLKDVLDKGLPKGFVDLMKRQKEIDDAKPIQERLGIGGEVYFMVLNSSRAVMVTSHRFDDYMAVWNEMLENLKHPSEKQK